MQFNLVLNLGQGRFNAVKSASLDLLWNRVDGNKQAEHRDMNFTGGEGKLHFTCKGPFVFGYFHSEALLGFFATHRVWGGGKSIHTASSPHCPLSDLGLPALSQQLLEDFEDST